MISIITCSINAQAAAEFQRNIQETIGVPHEVIVFDNRNARYGLSKVYNQCASEARYEYLCFCHEDVCFNTPNWGEVILNQLKNPDCGVIGFAGSVARPHTLSGWRFNLESSRVNYLQHDKKRKKHLKSYNPGQERFAQVITLDGFCLLMRKNVWAEIRFDEHTFDGFHGYDLDFSTAAAQKYKNYVCNEVLPEHFSGGAYSQTWIDYMSDYQKKWAALLPMYVTAPSPQQQQKDEQAARVAFLKILMQQRACEWSMINRSVACHMRQYPQYRSTYLLGIKYLKYRCKWAFRTLQRKSTIKITNA